MVSLAWKGLALERRLGSVRFLLTIAFLTLTSSALYVGLAVWGAELLDWPELAHQCAIGFSGVSCSLNIVCTALIRSSTLTYA